MLDDIPYCDLLPELRAQDATALAHKILVDLGITTRNFAGVPKLPDGLMIDPPPLVHPRIRANPLFTGREDLLEKLNVLLLGGPAKPAALLNVGGPSLGSNSMAAAKALGGLGGVGKTELAREFGWRNQSAYAGVWWIEAETRDGLLNGLIELGARFNPRIGEETEPRKSRARLPGRTRKSRPGKALASHLRQRGKPRRHRRLDAARGRALPHHLALARLDRRGRCARRGCVSGRCRRGLSLRDGGALSATGPGTGRALAKELGYLPLALSHAAAFCRARDTDFKDYLEKLAERVKEKPDRRSRAGKDYPWSVYETFELGLERVLAGQPELGVPPQPRAEELMGIMAYLGSDGIPLDLFPESLFSRDELSGLVAALNEAALLTRTRLPGGAPAVNVHRLVQRVMQVRLAAKASAAASAAAAVTLVADAFPGGDGDKDLSDVRSWPRCRLLEPHAVAALAHAPDEGDAAEKTAFLLNQYALHLRARADYAEAEPLYRRSIRVYEVSLGPEHPNVASGLNSLAVVLHDTDQLAEAEPLLRRALDIFTASLGPDHPNTKAVAENYRILLGEIEATKAQRALFHPENAAGVIRDRRRWRARSFVTSFAPSKNVNASLPP